MLLPDFWLGVHRPHWLGETDVPLFLSRRWLSERKMLPRARGPWALDSGAFTELNAGAWSQRTRDAWGVTVGEYAAEIVRFREEIGKLAWVAPMDFPCEPTVVWKNGIGLREHQRRTIVNFLLLREAVGEIVVPVLQGWEIADYERHIADYGHAGIDLERERLVGVGSVCRRSADVQIGRVLRLVAGSGIRMHAFGVRGSALRRYADLIASADSMAWSLDARMNHPPLPGCTHKTCTNCLRFALRWRERQIAGAEAALREREPQLQLEVPA